MKKVKIISFFMISLFLMLSLVVLASEPQISIGGENVLKPQQTKTVVVSVSNEEKEIGVVSGTIEKTSNITSISASGKNGWNLTFNQETGTFNIYKASGSKTEEIMNIEYTVSEQEGTAQIVLKDVKITTIDYETKNIGDITRVITIKNDEGRTENTNNTENKNTVENTTTNTVSNTNSSQQKNTINTKNKVNTTSNNNKMPQTGGISLIVIVLAIMIIISVIFYNKYIKYKNV